MLISMGSLLDVRILRFKRDAKIKSKAFPKKQVGAGRGPRHISAFKFKFKLSCIKVEMDYRSYVLRQMNCVMRDGSIF